MVDRLKGKVAIVTGGSKGLGQSIAEVFAREGALVMLAARDGEAAEAVAQGIRDGGGRAQATSADVTDPVSIADMFAQTRASLGPIDILINNAGQNIFGDPVEIPEDRWDACMDLNLKSLWMCARAAIPEMLERGGGSIVNMTSVQGMRINPNSFPYPVAKLGIVALTRSLGLEYARRGIRVNAIAPGFIMTPAADAIFSRYDDPAEAKRRAEARHPPGRLGRPEEVAMTALFLASDEAPFINCETIVIDGGRSHVYAQ
jgi:NAD(P)-dependent dehydrogenase (short-subunit alcohol dehydrogenase family)